MCHPEPLSILEADRWILTSAGCSKRPSSKAAANYHFIRGGWDDPNCARPTRGFSTARCASTEDRLSHPAAFFSILLEEAALLEEVFVNDGGRFGGKLSPFLQQTFDVFPDQV